MPAFALRFVGQETLPSRLSEFDREQFFELSSVDVTAIREEFRSDHRLPAALMLMFMRVAGRPLDGFTVLPRNLLRHTAHMLQEGQRFRCLVTLLPTVRLPLALAMPTTVPSTLIPRP